MAQPLFSIIIPTYGRAEYLAEAVDSVLAQTVADFECLVVDDGSPEPVSLSTEDDRVRVLRREINGGPSTARNTGLAHARGRFVAFLDDDDLYLPVRLALALEGLARAPVDLASQNADAVNLGRQRHRFGTAIVDDQALEILDRLGQDGVDGLSQVFSPPVGRDDDRKEGLGHSGSEGTSAWLPLRGGVACPGRQT